MDSGLTGEELTIAIVGVVSGTVLVLVLGWQLFATWRAYIKRSGDAGYRQVANASLEAQQQTAARLEQVLADVADLRARTIEIERILKEVE